MATAAVPSSDLLYLVRCGMCLDKYNDSDRLPKLLNCSHTFCLACMLKYHDSKCTNKIACPNCRMNFIVPRGGAQNLHTNIMVVNLLDHLAPFTADDTDGGVTEVSAVLQDKIPEKTGSTICGLHPGERCDFYCNDCKDPLCADCMVSITEGLHKTHKIRKLRDVLATYSRQHKDAVHVVKTMSMEGKQRTDELLEELVLSRYSLMKEVKDKCYEAHKKANIWYQNTIDTISNMYDELHDQILQFDSRSDLQELQQSLEKMNFQKIDRDSKYAQSFLDQLQNSVTSFKTSTMWPTKFWSVDIGNITDDFTVDLGHVTEPTLKLPNVNSFPYTIEDLYRNTDVLNSNVNKQTGQQPGFRLLSDLPMRPGCGSNVGLTTNEAVVYDKDLTLTKNILFNDNQTIVVNQCALFHDKFDSLAKYILKDNNVLFRDPQEGPTFILNSQLEMVSTIHEDYGDIIGADSIHWVAFCDADDDTSIRIYDLEQKQLVQALTAPADVRWLAMSSVCRHPDSGAIAAAHFANRTLCLFDHDGRHLSTQVLKYPPHPMRAISCNRRHLYVATYMLVSVLVFSWSGQLVATLDAKQLGIAPREIIHNIAVDDEQFTLAVGNNVVSSFKIFQCV